MYGVKTQKNVTVLGEPVTHSAVTPCSAARLKDFTFKITRQLVSEERELWVPRTKLLTKTKV